MKKISTFIILLMMPTIILAANTDKISIQSVKLIENDSVTETNQASFENLDLNLDINFAKEKSFITYEIELKNESTKKYEISNSSKVEGVLTINAETSDKVINPGETKSIKLKLQAGTFEGINFVGNNYERSVSIPVELTPVSLSTVETILPNTGLTSVKLLILVFLILISYVFYKLFKKSKAKTLSYIILITLLVPSIILAVEKLQININIKYRVAKPLPKLYNHIKDQSLGNDKELGIDYSQPNSETNGEGVYLFNETKDDAYPVYFYRGTHNLNNNLIYADFCWKVVRTTETGGIRLVYNGKPTNGECQTTTGDTTQIGESQFNRSYNHKKHVGYMYGKDASPYENIHDSTIKTKIDTWYEENIKNKGHEGMLDKVSTYCGDRSNEYLDGSNIKYQPNKRNSLHSPSLKCEVNDSYGVEGGNKALKYPVGLLTSDEALIAGGLNASNLNYYLYTNKFYWLLSPSSFNYYGNAFVLYVFSYGNLGDSYVVYGTYGVRPAVTLAPSTPLVGGDGSKKAPFLVS